jgi:glycosyltransferase involved in cell wall biosynthesis
MKVSIIVPVYNVEPYIERCFDSIVAQSHQDIECIFIDDASPDHCNEILRRRVAGYTGSIDFRILNHPSNQGLSAARNTGIRASSGDYLYFLDSDDDILESCIESLVAMVSKYPGVELVQGDTEIVPNIEGDFRSISDKPFPEFSEDREWIKTRMLVWPRIPPNAWNKLIKREFLLRHDLFFREGIIHEDEHWMFFSAKSVSSMAFVKHRGYRHFVVPGSIMQSGSITKSLASWILILEEARQNVDAICSSAQRQFIRGVLRGKLLELHEGVGEEELLRQYQDFVKNGLAASLRSVDFLEGVFYALCLLPPRLFGSAPIKAVTERLVKYA